MDEAKRDEATSDKRTKLADVNAMDAAAFSALLGAVFENAPWVASAAWAARPFASVDALHAAMMNVVGEADVERRLAFLRGHPELGGRLARAGAIGEASRQEQGSLGLDRLSIGEFARFERMNKTYRERFGIPFIIAVRMHTKESLLAAFEARLANAPDAELATALAEVGKITRIRLEALVADPPPPPPTQPEAFSPAEPVAAPPPPTREPSSADLKLAPDPALASAQKRPGARTGRLTTHVLDTKYGRPAEGVRIALYEIRPNGERLVASVVTNADGRTDAPLLAGAELKAACYELRFEIGAYYQSCGVPLPEPPLFDTVPLRFNISATDEHYHIPLLATPWSYTTYRGS